MIMVRMRTIVIMRMTEMRVVMMMRIRMRRKRRRRRQWRSIGYSLCDSQLMWCVLLDWHAKMLVAE